MFAWERFKTNLNGEEECLSSRSSWQSNKSRLKSELKKTLGLLKRIKNIDGPSLERIESDIQRLNLFRYIGDVTNAILENDTNAKNLNPLIHTVESFHRRYSKFTPALIRRLVQNIHGTEEVGIRITLSSIRLLCGLYASGIITNLSLIEEEFCKCILIENRYFPKMTVLGCNTLKIAITFCKYGGFFFQNLAKNQPSNAGFNYIPLHCLFSAIMAKRLMTFARFLVSVLNHEKRDFSKERKGYGNGSTFSLNNVEKEPASVITQFIEQIDDIFQMKLCSTIEASHRMENLLDAKATPDNKCGSTDTVYEDLTLVLDGIRDAADVTNLPNQKKLRMDGVFWNSILQLMGDNEIDSWCVNFSKIAAKHTWTSLLRCVTNIQDIPLKNIKPYTRIVAVCCHIHPNLKSIFVKNIVDSFIEQLIKSASFYDVKIRTAAMIAESLKYNLFAPEKIFQILRHCLSRFVGLNVEICCVMLEICGKFLYCTLHTRNECNYCLETMMRLSNIRKFSSTVKARIENACLSTKGKNAPLAPLRITAEIYVCHKVFSVIDLDNYQKLVDQIGKTLSRDPFLLDTIVKILIRLSSEGGSNIILITQVYACMCTKLPIVAYHFIDEMCEQILDLHKSITKQEQLCLCEVVSSLFFQGLLSIQCFSDFLCDFIFTLAKSPVLAADGLICFAHIIRILSIMLNTRYMSITSEYFWKKTSTCVFYIQDVKRKAIWSKDLSLSLQKYLINLSQQCHQKCRSNISQATNSVSLEQEKSASILTSKTDITPAPVELDVDFEKQYSDATKGKHDISSQVSLKRRINTSRLLKVSFGTSSNTGFELVDRKTIIMHCRSKRGKDTQKLLRIPGIIHATHSR